MTQQPQVPGQGAQNVTQSEAADIIRRTRSGQPTPESSPTAPAEPGPAQIPKVSADHFQAVNPLVKVYAPKSETDHIRGYVVGAYTDPGDSPFYLLQTDDGLAAVYEAPSLKVLGMLLPSWKADPHGIPRAVAGHEVIVEPAGRFGFLVKARALRVDPAGEAIIRRPPPWPVPAAAAPYALTTDAGDDEATDD